MHPSEPELVALAQSEITGARRATLNAHLAGCQRCRDVVQGARSVIARVADVEAPRASDELLARILARREKGERAIVSAVDTPRSLAQHDMVRRRWTPSHSIAAGVALAMLGGSAARWVTAADDSPVATANRMSQRLGGAESEFGSELGLDFAADVAGEVGSAFSPLPRTIGAQATPSSVPRKLPPPITGVDGSRLLPARWSYVESFRDAAGRSVPRAVTHLELDRTTYRNRPVLRLAQTSVRHGAMHDTLLLDPVDLRPIQQRLHVGRYIVTTEYPSASAGDGPVEARVIRAKRDSGASGAVRVDTLRMALHGRGFVWVLENQLDLLFRTTKLHRGWRGTVGRVTARTKDLVARPGSMTLAVVGEEMVEYPLAPSRAAWRVVIAETSRGGMPMQTVYLVGKDDGAVLRSTRPSWTFTPRGDPDGEFVTELMRR